MIFIYLFYVIGRTDCQLTKGHILEWMFYRVLWGFIGEWWFIGGSEWEFKGKEERENIKDLYDYVTLVENYPRTD